MGVTIKTILLCVCIFMLSLNCSARLRMLPGVEKIACIKNKPSHIVLFLKGDDKALFSSDYGDTWTRVNKADYTNKLIPPPIAGPIKFSFGDKHERHLFCSKNSGKTWHYIYPYIFLSKETQNIVDGQKATYMKKYGNRIPHRIDFIWIVVFLCSSLSIIVLFTFLNRNRKNVIFHVALMSFFVYATVGIASFLSMEHITNYLLYEQWKILMSNCDGILIPKWHFGILSNILSNFYFAPVLCILTFPLTPMFFETCRSIEQEKKRKWVLYSGITLVVCFAIYIIITVFTGFYWDF